MKELLKRLIDILPGSLALAIYDVTSPVRLPRQIRNQRCYERQLYEKLGHPQHILQGPFQGMHYLSRSCGSRFLPKLLGTYELELTPAIKRLCQLGSDLIVNVGAAEGYYAVGMALHNPQAQIVCYDTYKPARYLAKRLSHLNKVSKQLSLKRLCTTVGLNEVLAGAKQPVVICDIEGAEEDLLHPDRAPNLRKSAILVELHDGRCKGVSERLWSRFETSHDILTFDIKPRSLDDLPPDCPLTPEEAKEAMDEHRKASSGWYLMLPKLNKESGSESGKG